MIESIGGIISALLQLVPYAIGIIFIFLLIKFGIGYTVKIINMIIRFMFIGIAWLIKMFFRFWKFTFPITGVVLIIFLLV